jgi:hypothetical protein
MKNKIFQFLTERNVEYNGYSSDTLYNAGMEYVMKNIEFYHDKPYSCDTVIKELFVRGIIYFIDDKKGHKVR